MGIGVMRICMRVLDSGELELQTVMRHYVGARDVVHALMFAWLAGFLLTEPFN